jgi:uncharacterized protein (TIGR02145 family)
MVWNTNEDFYLGEGVYVWGDGVWVPIQRTLFSNSTVQPITTVPFVTVRSNPAEGLGVTFQIPSLYADISNTARFLWEVEASGTGYTPKDSASGSRHEVLFVPYDVTERTYKARAKAISYNGTSDSDWSDEVESDPGTYKGWYRIIGPTGYDICQRNLTDSLYGRKRTQMSLTENYYTVETLGGTGEANYKWEITTDETGGLVSLGGDEASATVELKFNNSILTHTDLVGHPEVAKTIVLQCNIDDGRGTPYTLTRKITVGDRDECSPTAGLLDAQGNRYMVSKFGDVCWMTQNLRSTYTMRGNQKQELIEESNNKYNDNDAVFYYYPGSYTSETNPAEYGLLYTWGAANIGTATTESTNAFPNKTSDRQGICPEGWAIPSDYDWNQLEKEVAVNPGLYSAEQNTWIWFSSYETMADWRPNIGGPTVVGWGRSMKSPTTVTTAANGLSLENGVGFNALLVGIAANGSTSLYGTYTTFWSSSAGNATTAWRRELGGSPSGVGRYTSGKSYLFSVRCKKIDYVIN